MRQFLTGFTPYRSLLLGLVLLYLVTRFTGLTQLPVFADEAIYIRWAQLTIQDPQTNLFLPLYDGKTPLMMWLSTLFLRLQPLDPLWSVRVMSVLAGAGTMILMGVIAKALGAGRVGVGIAMGTYLLLPFAFFHDRLAIIESVYGLVVALLLYGLLQLKRRATGWNVLLAGGLFGGAILTKLPALLLLPLWFWVLWFMPPSLKPKQQQRRALLFALCALIGPLMLYSMRFMTEWFPFLFQRSGDFTFSVGEFLGGEWRHSMSNIQQFLGWMAWYLGPLAGVVIAVFLHLPRLLRTQPRLAYTLVGLGLMALTVGVPFLMFGRIVFSRYYFPLVIFVVPLAGLWLEDRWKRGQKWLVSLFAGGQLIYFLWFALPLWTSLFSARLPMADQQQYLSEWSAGFGIGEARDYISERATHSRVVVATEGYFGTLPDGLLMYFDRSPLIEHLEIFGIGQPIREIPPDLLARAQNETVLIVGNENRLNLDLDCCTIRRRVEKPYGGAALLVLEVGRWE